MKKEFSSYIFLKIYKEILKSRCIYMNRGVCSIDQMHDYPHFQVNYRYQLDRQLYGKRKRNRKEICTYIHILGSKASGI